ncbi:MAG: hypothetical protein JWQ95_2487 [Sphaerisporangium sp.]|nr:hypothetical protein [Sphaerisporangium sp.]
MTWVSASAAASNPDPDLDRARRALAELTHLAAGKTTQARTGSSSRGNCWAPSSRTARLPAAAPDSHHRGGTLAWHTVTGKRPATRQAAVTDLIIDVRHAWRNYQRNKR